MLSSIAALFIGFLSSCSDDKTVTDKKWVTAYQNITLGNQKNYTDGHFLKLKTGESVKLENVSGQEESLAFMIFTDYGVNNTYLTFPANAADAATFKTELAANRLFVQPNVGLNNWNSAKMVNGMIYKVSAISAAELRTCLHPRIGTSLMPILKKPTEAKSFSLTVCITIWNLPPEIFTCCNSMAWLEPYFTPKVT